MICLDFSLIIANNQPADRTACSSVNLDVWRMVYPNSVVLQCIAPDGLPRCCDTAWAGVENLVESRLLGV